MDEIKVTEDGIPDAERLKDDELTVDELYPPGYNLFADNLANQLDLDDDDVYYDQFYDELSSGGFLFHDDYDLVDDLVDGSYIISEDELPIIDNEEESEKLYLQYQKEVEEGKRISNRLKWIAEGAINIEELSEMLQEQADYYKRLAAQGWQLEYPVDESYVELILPDDEDDN